MSWLSKPKWTRKLSKITISKLPRQGRGRGRSSPSSSNNYCPVCLVCNKTGHMALDCYYRYDESYQQDTSQGQAYLSTPQSSTDANWYPDSGATHHLTSELANLNVKAEEYSGFDTIRVGNGNGLLIHHVGTTQITTPSFKLHLNNVLHVPNICKNLLSVQRFTKDTNTFFEFHLSYFFFEGSSYGETAASRPE